MDLPQIYTMLDNRLAQISSAMDALCDEAPDPASMAWPNYAEMATSQSAIDDGEAKVSEAETSAHTTFESDCQAALQGHVQAATGQLDEHHHVLGTLASTLADAYVSIESSMGACSEQEVTARDELHTSHQSFHQLLQTLMATHLHQIAALEAALKQLDSDIEHEFMPPLFADMGTASADVEHVRTSTLGELEQRIKNTFATGAEAYVESAEQVANAFCDSVHAATQELATFAENSIVSMVEGAVQRLQAQAIHAIEDAIAKAIIETETNIAVTSALGSIMPELIAINRALPALEAAVQLYKQMRDLMNPFG